jgi:predicted metalloprotease with PDZ domain
VPGTDDDDEPFGGPPPLPEERTWVHPSELAGRNAPSTPPDRRFQRRWIGAAAIGAGAVFAGTMMLVNQAVTLEPAQDAANTRFIAIVTTTTLAEPAGAWLGVSGVDSERGVLLTACDSAGPALHAGLRPDDVVTHVDDASLTTMSALTEHMKQVEPGVPVTVTVVRDGAPLTVTVTAASHPTP